MDLQTAYLVVILAMVGMAALSGNARCNIAAIVLLGGWALPKLLGTPPPVWAETGVSIMALYIYIELQWVQDDDTHVPLWPVYLFVTEILQLLLNGVNIFDLVGTRAYLISQNIIFASQIFLVLGLSARLVTSRLLKPKPARKKAEDTTLPRWLTAGRKIDAKKSIIYRALRAAKDLAKPSKQNKR